MLILLALALGCSTQSAGLLTTRDGGTKAASPTIDADVVPDTVVASISDAWGATEDTQSPDAVTWKNSLTFGTSYTGDGGIGPMYDGEGDVLLGQATSFSSREANRLVFRLESAADITGRSVVLYVGGDIANIRASAAGPESGHVILGIVSLEAGASMVIACLTTADRSKAGWNVGMVCIDVSGAYVTVGP
jgi:hypothetical protein